MSDLAEAAVAYAESGWAVFPLEAGSKEPATMHGFKDATTDAEVIRAIWADYPDFNIGLATGEPSGGVFAIDLDCDHDTGEPLGADALADWEGEHVKLPDTVCAVTRNGGTHLLYRSRERVTCSSNRELRIDVRGDGGYIVAPPSRVKADAPFGSGVYEWDLSPEVIEVADANKAVYEFLAHVQSGAGVEFSGFELPDEVHEGEGRNNAVFGFVRSMRAKSVPPKVIEAAARAYNVECCKPPLRKSELDKTIKSGISKEPGYSDEVKQAQAARAEKPWLTAKGRPIPGEFAQMLVEKRRACKVDGVPAIWERDHYAVGWGAIDRAIVECCDGTKMQDRREIRDYLNIVMADVGASDPRYIAFTNGILDSQTGDFVESSADYVITNVIPHRWNPGAKCDAADELLLNVSAGNDETYVNLLQVMGMCLMRTNRFQQSPILIGDGANGKSTFIKALRRMLGADNVSTLDVGMFSKQFYTGQLAGKLANLGDDISSDFLAGDQLAVFRKVISGEWMYADVKGSQGFDFQPYCTVVLSANDFPKMKDVTYGMSRRLFPIPFNATFAGDKADPTLEGRLDCEEASERLIQLAAVGIATVAANGGKFSPNAAGDAERREIERMSDSVVDWVLDNGFGRADFANFATENRYKIYESWCLRNGCKPVAGKTFSRRVNKFFGLQTKKKRVNGDTVKVFAMKSAQQ